MTHIIEISTANIRHSTMANSQEVYLGDSNNDRQSEMAAETGNTYISVTIWGTVKIPTTNLRFKTMYKWKIVLARSATAIDNRKYRYAPKTGNNYISGTLIDSVEIPTPNSGFLMLTSSTKISQMIATTIDYQKLQDWRPNRLYCHWRLSVVVAIARGQFLRAGRGRKPQICCWNCHPISVAVPEI